MAAKTNQQTGLPCFHALSKLSQSFAAAHPSYPSSKRANVNTKNVRIPGTMAWHYSKDKPST